MSMSTGEAECYQRCQRNSPIRHENMASVLASATTSCEILKKLQLYWARLLKCESSRWGEYALKQWPSNYLFICSWSKIVSERFKINKTDKTTQYKSKVGCSESSFPNTPAPPFSPSQTFVIPRLPKAQFESTVFNDLQGHFQVDWPVVSLCVFCLYFYVNILVFSIEGKWIRKER